MAVADPVTNRYAVGTSRVQIAVSNPSRRILAVSNADATTSVTICGATGATSGRGIVLTAGSTLTLDDYLGPLYAIAASTVNVDVTELWA